MTLNRRKRLAALTNWLFPGYGHCKRCKLNWKLAARHATPYLRADYGTFSMSPLCEQCWQECSVEQRLPYYLELWEEWNELEEWPRDADADWQTIENAVREEKQA